MMEKLVQRGEEIAREAQARELGRVAEQLRTLFGGASVDVEDAQVIASGKGMMRRWLSDPRLRFLGGVAE